VEELLVLQRFVAALRPLEEFLPQMAGNTPYFEGFGAFEAGTSLVAREGMRYRKPRVVGSTPTAGSISN